ncbi:MAG: ribonuclease P protein component [Proteobacteria bacterium]|nr:ribonuclease P protein component [Pseudomonadota bacterium]
MQDSQCKHENSFAAAQRIPRSEGYGQCLKAHVISDKYFKLFFMPNHTKKARLGIVVAKRYIPKSVDRNKAKRAIRELFRVHQIKGCGIDLVVMARNGERPDADCLNNLFSRVATRCA